MFIVKRAHLAQKVERWPFKPMVVGSIPTVGAKLLRAFLAEGSKALRSGRSIFGCVGSNPTECNQNVSIYAMFCVRT